MNSAIKVLWNLIWRVGILLALWQGVLMSGVGGRISSAESNLVSNQIGMQEVARTGNPDLVLVGSSLMVRLDAEVIERKADFAEAIQMGLNGGRSLLGLEILGQLEVEAGGLVIEANTFGNPKNENEKTLLNHPEEGVFHLAKAIPWVRAKNRPSSLVYHHLKKWRDNRLGPLPGRPRREVRLGFAGPDSERRPPSPKAVRKAGEVAERVRDLGVPWPRILLVMLPDQGSDRSESYEISQVLVEDHGAQILDLKGYEEPGDYRYADGLHLDATSGKRASVQVVRALQKMGVASRD